MPKAGEVCNANFKAAVRRESVCFKFTFVLARLRELSLKMLQTGIRYFVEI